MKGKIQTNESFPISIRVKPTQIRAVETRERILDAAALILEESGADGLTTKKTAERAGVRIRSVYRYFPNKLSIIYSLAQRVAEKEALFLTLYEGLGNQKVDWRPSLSTMVDLFFMAGKEIPGLRAIRAAMQASPELRSIDVQMNERHAAELSKALKARGADLSGEQLDAISRTFIETATCLLDGAWFELSQPGGDQKAKLMVTEMKRILEAYVSSYFQ
ncbi:MAG: TetR/AcrR family transcriptional regulator [Proteobacteria bacterium]|nr:TetR/AcrR family transcriptional regulator [Pseudomonadota bacterium]